MPATAAKWVRADDAVADKAGETLREVPGTDHPHVRTLLAAVPSIRAFTRNPEPAVNAAKYCQEVYPDLVLDIAERFFEVHGQKAADLTTASSAQAHALAEFVTSIYARDPDSDLGSRALGLIDTMVLLRSLGLEERLASLDR
jgi:hypothetical protein